MVRYTWFPTDIRTINPSIIPHPNKMDVDCRGGEDEYNWYCRCSVVCRNHLRGNISEISVDVRWQVRNITNTSHLRRQVCRWHCHTQRVNINIGPHDSRVFYGSQSPYIIYASNSQFACFGQWMQDFRAFINWPVRLWVADADKEYLVSKELQRPQFSPAEKN